MGIGILKAKKNCRTMRLLGLNARSKQPDPKAGMPGYLFSGE
ncbi:hypothetical protein ApDm4_0938 [Acetobacter pomorum]|nr:hypothetical protein ApDm4_0938 [Acetobacter pomorum]